MDEIHQFLDKNTKLSLFSRPVERNLKPAGKT